MDEHKVRLEISELSKSYETKEGRFQAVEKIDLKVYDNEFLVLLGPGNCGKTVLLNMIAGLEQPTSGEIRLDGSVIQGSDRRIGMVFQKLALMPWKTVMQNTEIGPKFRGVKKEERRKKAQSYIDLVGLNGFEKAYPAQLSGGMKQRVGIARAYTNDPEILLMDEPFGALDAQTRFVMEQEVQRIWEQEKRTIIFVTNNIEEACFLGDRIVLFSECPARMKEIYVNDLKRPRDVISQEFLKLRAMISDNTDLAL
ncbi:MAG: ABC transporter ATP-binding protein [Lachnospiraceae bacterium]|jgi:ABC-type nitrate/sulfonate/bicarbonate transport system, ATPase component|nr:ABC transporter ATP-binding protein [Lachnospiraceae bacterium]MCI9657348.1 ABC transporter ATP-binding protein [Lachnospiraceae bacterium]